MPCTRNNWQYLHSKEKKQIGYTAYDRQELLSTCPVFEQILDLVHSEISNIEYIPEQGDCQELKDLGCKRASWFFDVKPTTFDLLFNGINGLRGQYYLGSDLGICKNHELILMLKHKLLETISDNAWLTQIESEISLNHLWARFWIDEAQAHWDDDVEINNAWIPHPELGYIGKEAPTGTRVYINGAWINSQGKAYLFSKKKNRSYDIFKYGFS